MLFFHNKLEMEQILRKGFDLMQTTFFQSSEMEEIIPKTVLLLKMSHLELN